ncbi:MAG: hypothetical protein EPN85_06255 [Bacteroidetes bacterium]|nr:MAG: hypothetical protein EPN85_06255 [Bacteroidota bacterium]
MKKTGILLLLFSVFLFLAFNKHSKDDHQSYQSVLWADASGYYVYNPIWFIYGNDCSSMPDSIRFKTGTGFSFNEKTGNIITKYTSGVAILQAPFFLVAHILSGPMGFPSDGFSPIYHGAIMIAGTFYGLLGLLFSFLFLKKYFLEKISLITVSVFFLGTNLFYYTLDASGFLHVYSFFLISAIAYLTTKIYKAPLFKFFLPLLVSLALVMLIRPTNIILVIFIFFFGNTFSFPENIAFFRQHLKPVFISLLISLSILIPQLIYWSQSFNSPIVYSYGEEGFPFLLSPKLIPVWFSTNNGLFTWAPVLFTGVAGMAMALWKKDRNGIIITVIFLLSSYVFSSWWNYWFGCAMGARSFVEYYPLLMFPFTYVISQIKSKVGMALLFVFFAGCIWINLNIIYYYDGCFYGGEWDWNAYFKLVTD